VRRAGATRELLVDQQVSGERGWKEYNASSGISETA